MATASSPYFVAQWSLNASQSRSISTSRSLVGCSCWSCAKSFGHDVPAGQDDRPKLALDPQLALDRRIGPSPGRATAGRAILPSHDILTTSSSASSIQIDLVGARKRPHRAGKRCDQEQRNPVGHRPEAQQGALNRRFGAFLAQKFEGGGSLWSPPWGAVWGQTALRLLYRGRPGRVRAIRPCQGPVLLAF